MTQSRRNSKDKKQRKASKEKRAESALGLINTMNSESDKQSSAKQLSPLISVNKMSEGSYDKIVESDDESGSSFAESHLSGTSSERAKIKEMRESNVFLMKVIHGRVPNELLTSRITSTDRENLSTLIPHLQINQQNSTNAADQYVFTYQDVYEEARKSGIRSTEISESARFNNLSTLLPTRQQ